MALAPCRECKTRVSTSAMECPVCSATNPADRMSVQGKRRLRTMIRVLFSLGVAIAAVLYFWYGILSGLHQGILNQAP